jgi:hypothetical protein
MAGDAAGHTHELIRLRDHLRGHGDILGEHTARLVKVETQLEGVMHTVPRLATQEHVENAKVQLELKLDHLTKVVDPIRKVINWAAGLIVGAVLLGLLALLFKTG